MIFKAALSPVLNRGSAPQAFLDEMVKWGKTADESIFAPNAIFDIYSKVSVELGPWRGPIHRRAVMLEVLRVLAGFESSWDWREGVDTSRMGADTPENNEAGAWQVSYGARSGSPELRALLVKNGILDGVKFQQSMKFNHPLALEFVARMLRYNTRENGPLYKGDERMAIRRSLRGPENSIYPWLKPAAVDEFMAALEA